MPSSTLSAVPPRSLFYMVTPLTSSHSGPSALHKSFLLMTIQPMHTNYSLLSRCMQFSLTYAWYRIHCSSLSAFHHTIYHLFVLEQLYPARVYVRASWWQCAVVQRAYIQTNLACSVSLPTCSVTCSSSAFMLATAIYVT